MIIMNAVKTDKEVLERIKRKIIVLERKNLITKEFSNIEILKEIRNIIEEEVEVDQWK